MVKKCNICGMMKKTTFNCDRCKQVICLNCYNFIINKCADCVTLEYGENYRVKINKYIDGTARVTII